MRKALRRLWHARRFSIRPTARGWQAFLFGAFSLLAARLIGTTQLYQLAYALAGLLLVALVLGFFLFRGLRYERRVPAEERFVAGRHSHVELVVLNTSQAGSPGVEVVDHLPERRLLEMPPVGGRGRQTLREPVLLTRRGLYELGPAEIQTADPLGLLCFIRRFGTPEEVVVYPEVFELAGFPVRRRSREEGVRGSFTWQGDEFSGLREYRQGDDRRHIHWKSVARMGELIVKEFAHNARQRYAVVLDLHRTSVHVLESEVEDAVSAAGSVLLHLAREDLPFRLLCTDKERNATEFGTDEGSYWRAMGLLAVARADGGTEPGDFLREQLREERERLGEGVVLVSRSLDDGLIGGVQRLRAVGLSVVAVVLATHTYRRIYHAGNTPSGREVAFSEDVRRLEIAGAAVCVVRHPGGVAAFAGGRQGVAGVRGAV